MGNWAWGMGHGALGIIREVWREGVERGEGKCGERG